MSIVGRALLLVAGLVLAIPAGALTLMIGIAREPAAQELIGALGVASFEAILEGVPFDDAPEMVAGTLELGLWTLSMSLVVLPPTLVALMGEIAGTRSFVWYGGAGGLLTAALPWLVRGDIPTGAMSPALAAEGRLTALLFLTGAVAGLTYWLVAGRTAGRPIARGREPGGQLS